MNALEVFGSFEKAAELDKQPHTGCTLSSTQRHVALSPKYIGRLRTGVGEILDAELGRFSESLRGVLLAYGNVKLLQSAGVIVDDSPFIHFDVKFDAVVFNPKLGSLLKCVVIEQASDHVGCLVHDWFNVSLLADRREFGGQELPKLEPGYVVLVQVEHLRSLNGMLAIEARAPDDGSDFILEMKSLQSKDTDSESNVDSVLQSSVSDTPDVAGKSSGTPGNKASSEKKKKCVGVEPEEVDSLQPSVTDVPDITPMLTVTAGTEASKKKKKKKHAKTEVLGVHSFQPSVIDSADGSGVLITTSGAESKSDKKKRKHANRKHEFDVDSLQPSISDSPDGSSSSKRTAGEEAMSGKKKKKHGKIKQELDVDFDQPSLCLETSTGETQTNIVTTKYKKSKKHKKLETTNGTNDMAEVTTGKETSSKKKKHLKNEAPDPHSEVFTNHSGYEISMTGEKTNSVKKKKKKDRQSRTSIDSLQPLFAPNGPIANMPEHRVETMSQESGNDDVVCNLLPLLNKQSPATKQFTKLKKHKDKETHRDVDSSLQPLAPSKKHKKKNKRDKDGRNGTCAVNSLSVKGEPGTESNCVSGSSLTLGLDTEVTGQKSHKKRKRKGAEIEDSLTGGGKKKKKTKER